MGFGTIGFRCAMRTFTKVKNTTILVSGCGILLIWDMLFKQKMILSENDLWQVFDV